MAKRGSQADGPAQPSKPAEASVIAEGEPLEPSFRVRANLKRDAAGHLRQLILTGRLRPGQKVDQDAVAAALGISRLPVREALIELAQEGLVVTPPRRGAFVANLERADLLDHYMIYGLLSGIAAERAASSLTQADLDELASLHLRLKRDGTAQLLETLNFRFHRLINSAASGRLRAALRLFLRTLPSHYFEFAPEWSRVAINDHAKILKALETRDGLSARAAMENHLRHSGQHAVTLLERLGFWPTPSVL